MQSDEEAFWRVLTSVVFYYFPVLNPLSKLQTVYCFLQNTHNSPLIAQKLYQPLKSSSSFISEKKLDSRTILGRSTIENSLKEKSNQINDAMESKTNIDLQLFLNFKSSSNLMQGIEIFDWDLKNLSDQLLSTGRLFAFTELSNFYS